MDLDTVVKSFYFWKVFTKNENLPFPPTLRILPIHHSYWDGTKHESDVKTACNHKFKTTIQNNNLGAKTINIMIMIFFLEVHLRTNMFTHGTEENLNSHTSLERQIVKCSSGKLIDETHFVCRTLQSKSTTNKHVTFFEVRCCIPKSIARETCHSPKQNIMDNLKYNTVLNSEVADRFKFCKGKTVCRVSDIDYTGSDAHAKGPYIVCKKRTNWCCILCRNFACHDNTEY